ncbi:MAG: hypothetical protein NC312_08495 [Bacteroides fragilis]|nr:hypothetical protein [Bacteroides fragilis]
MVTMCCRQTKRLWLMGHAKELTTIDVYGDNANIILEEIPEQLSYMEEVMPKKADNGNASNNIEDTVINTDGFLPHVV